MPPPVAASSEDRLYIFDTTLRDGAQTQGVDFSVDEKKRIAAMLDRLGVDYIEGGFAGANPTDIAFFSRPPALKTARLTAFGMTHRPGRSVENDPGLAAALDGETPAVCLVGKSWDMHVRDMLEIPLQANLDAIAASIGAVAAAGKEAIFDAEHFFDGFRSDPDFASACIEAALKAGARWAVLCDTNGGTLPEDVRKIAAAAVQRFGGERLGIHAHNDAGLAVANTLAAVDAGVRQIQGTLNGLGERCGNADLVALLPTLKFKPRYSRLRIGVSSEALSGLCAISRGFDDILNRRSHRHAPYVGAAAFAHKGGLHAAAVAKNPRSYEHIDPERVGNRRSLPVSDQAGRASLRAALARFDIALDADDPRLASLLESLKEREKSGYAYDGADAGFELFVRRRLGVAPAFFEVERFRVIAEQRHNALGQLISVSEAAVKLRIDGAVIHSVAEGNGPVNALDRALRKDLGKHSETLRSFRLTDYKVRIIDSGTEAVTRVQIETGDDDGRAWTTVGVSSNIIEASFEALADALIYGLMRSDRSSDRSAA